ncbi:MAG: beta-ribofuranosylaminobenzene 5'-phosphate synthase [Alphaproteobacteria bacterium]|nr:beta-ribofuranosylaminobenzene 5'-phosphate synthase [Alphaproteobacteria bacterium]MBU6472541.1 beta-ribofuranosylaminobenzene 5'-phosphate synthase [Alphaproteobacteria bacterium]MDE2012954.1 beta-ribofuranosylaminobenzene 5'-phosphate synthase [Alphaproteobacteria bacterium]MDE2074593.1 beta-ribofuranosylaminobenzene 5'-phosphate synthase [Alphaproteobacteria bacterium]MDE2351429.1 beta-ribofuranosylaminobenzene 5'-phosphate synthase [Alphaproteobacteria bacterium]
MTQSALRIRTHSRLAFGLIDMNGEIGRVEGGLGLTLEDPCLVLRARRAETISIGGPAEVSDGTRRKFTSMWQVFREKFGIEGVAVEVEEAIPGHSGLGSGTQLALAFGQALNLLYDLNLKLPEIERIGQRGGTSGIGCAAFVTGGFLADGGHRFGVPGGKTMFAPSAASAGFSAPPILFHSNLPSSWRVVLALPAAGRITHGDEEKALFLEHCPVPSDEAAQSARLALLKVLPAIMEADLEAFGDGLEGMQRYGLKRIQIARQNEEVRGTMNEMRRLGLHGVGMSSWGPALFGFTDADSDKAQEIVKTLETFGDTVGGVRVILTSAAEHGATWTWE